MYGFVHTLTLVRDVNHTDAMFSVTGVAAGKIIFSKISFILPDVEPSQVVGTQLKIGSIAPILSCVPISSVSIRKKKLLVSVSVLKPFKNYINEYC